MRECMCVGVYGCMCVHVSASWLRMFVFWYEPIVHWFVNFITTYLKMVRTGELCLAVP